MQDNPAGVITGATRAAVAVDELPLRTAYRDVRSARRSLLQVLDDLVAKHPDFHLGDIVPVLTHLLQQDEGPATDIQLLQVSARLLAHLASGYHNLSLDEDRVDVTEAGATDFVRGLLQVWGMLLGRVHESYLGSQTLRTLETLHNTMTTLSHILNVTRYSPEVLELTGPGVKLQAKKLFHFFDEDLPRTFLLDKKVVQPQQLGEPTSGLFTIVKTTLNPVGFQEYYSDFVRVMYPANQYPDFLARYLFPMDALRQEDFTLSGQMSCVQARDYAMGFVFCGWKVAARDAATFTVYLPPAGSTRFTLHRQVTVAGQTWSGGQQLPGVCLEAEGVVGRLCWPLRDGQQVSVEGETVRLVATEAPDGDPQIQLVNSGEEKREITLRLRITHRIVEPARGWCRRCSREDSTTTTALTPISMKVWAEDISCLRYDESSWRYVGSSSGQCGPASLVGSRGIMRCVCEGPGLVVVGGPTMKVVDNLVMEDVSEADPTKPDWLTSPVVFVVVLAFLFLNLLVSPFWNRSDGARLTPLRPIGVSETLHFDVQYTLFVYCPLLRSAWRKSREMFVTLKDDTSREVEYTFRIPTTFLGDELRLLFPTNEQLEPIQWVKLHRGSDDHPLQVGRMILSDPFKKELVMFKPWKGEKSVWKRYKEAYHNRYWKESCPVTMIGELGSRLPTLLFLFPPKPRLLRADRILVYVVGLFWWALFCVTQLSDILLLNTEPDDVELHTPLQNFHLQFAMNLFITALALLWCEHVVAASLNADERILPLDTRKWWQVKRPFPYQFRWIVRLTSCSVGTILVCGLVVAYLHLPPWAFAYLCGKLVEGFCYQILAVVLLTGAGVVGQAISQLPDKEKVKEDVFNPGGVRMQCPQCQCYVRSILEHDFLHTWYRGRLVT